MPLSMHHRQRASADVFDDLHEFVHAVPVEAGEVDELPRSQDDGAPLGRPRDRDATPTPELEQPLVAGTPERGAVVQRARELVDFARHHGYRVDELVEIIEDVG